MPGAIRKPLGPIRKIAGAVRPRLNPAKACPATSAAIWPFRWRRLSRFRRWSHAAENTSMAALSPTGWKRRNGRRSAPRVAARAAFPPRMKKVHCRQSRHRHCQFAQTTRNRRLASPPPTDRRAISGLAAIGQSRKRKDRERKRPEALCVREAATAASASGGQRRKYYSCDDRFRSRCRAPRIDQKGDEAPSTRPPMGFAMPPVTSI